MFENNLPYFLILAVLLIIAIYIEHELMVVRAKRPFTELVRFIVGLATVILGTASGYLLNVATLADEMFLVLCYVGAICGSAYLINAYRDSHIAKEKNQNDLLNQIKQVERSGKPSEQNRRT